MVSFDLIKYHWYGDNLKIVQIGGYTELLCMDWPFKQTFYFHLQGFSYREFFGLMGFQYTNIW